MHEAAGRERSLIRWGILGTGRMARAFARCLREVPDAELVGVASRTSTAMDAFLAVEPVPKPCTDYAALLRDPAIDVVFVATPHALHAEHCAMALQAGKAVLCEKPFTINATEAAGLIELARRRGLFLMEAMWTRFVPAVVKLRELLAQRAIGDIQLMIAGGAFVPEPDPDFYLFRPELGGGVLLDAGVYLVSLASLVFGAPTRIEAVGSRAESGVDEHEAILLAHPGGGIASLYVSLRTRAAPGMTLLGSEGRIDVEPPVFAPKRIVVHRHEKSAEVLELPFAADGYQFEAIEVGACLAAGRTESESMPLDESLRIMQTLDEVRARLGVRYPMEKA